jgi:hypothetical protein
VVGGSQELRDHHAQERVPPLFAEEFFEGYGGVEHQQRVAFRERSQLFVRGIEMRREPVFRGDPIV